MMSYDMYGYTNEHKFEKFHVWERFGNKSDEHFETDICFECFHTYDNLDRISNLYIYTETAYIHLTLKYTDNNS